VTPMNARQTMINTGAILLVVFLAWFLVQIRSTLVLLLIGILFAAAIEPAVNRLRRRGMRRGQAILVIYATILLAVAVGLLLLIPSIVRQSDSLIDDIPSILQSSREQAEDIGNSTVRDLAIRGIGEVEEIYDDSREGDGPIGGEQAIAVASSIGGALISIVTVLVVAFYWLTEKSIIKRVLLRRVPIGQQDRAADLWGDIERRIGGWARGQLTLMLIIGLVSTLAYLAMGLDYWLALGIWAGLTELVPFIGPILGGAAAFAVALTDSWQKALLVLVFVLILQQVESALLVPRVMRNSVGMTPLTVVLAVLIGSTLAGPLGAILAIPLGAAVQAIVQEVVPERLTDAEREVAGIGPSG
jgi:predicted PurR-regulated permease PerM